MNNNAKIGLHLILTLLGVFIIFSGIDSAFGGLNTLGLLGETSYFTVTDEYMFQIVDSHTRFFGGVWMGIGVIFFFAQKNLTRYQDLLKWSFAILFLGGLSRFTQLNLDVILTEDVLWAICVEIIGMPILYFWLSKVVDNVDQEEVRS